MSKKFFILIVALIIIGFFSYLYFSGKISRDYVPTNISTRIQPITLEYWKVWDSPEVFADLISEFNQKHPNIQINYRKFRYDEYEKELIEAFARDKGPDIFSIQNIWMKKYQQKELISAMPEKISKVEIQTKDGFRKEVKYLLSTDIFNLAKLEKEFVDVVYDDVVITVKDENNNYTEKIFGLPLFVDTMAMYYNKDLFNNAGINTAPEYWNREFLQDVKKLTKQNSKGEIVQSGVALGGSLNINRSVDILSLLMMQNGTQMMNNNRITFHLIPELLKSRGEIPGIDALRFYTDFSNPAKEVYSWNNTLDNSIDLFMRGKLAMMFGYSYLLPQIDAGAPNLNYAVSQMPQIEGNNFKINYANYWVEVVSSKIKKDSENLSKDKAEYAKVKEEAAWAFLQFITEKENAKRYLERVKKPSALRSVVLEQVEDNDIGVFASQVLTSRNWYHGIDAVAGETIMNQMIDDVIEGAERNIGDIILTGARRMQQTID